MIELGQQAERLVYKPVKGDRRRLAELGPYNLFFTLGRGDFSQVVAATSTITQEQVVIKIPNRKPDALRIVNNDAAMHQKFSDLGIPNIVPLVEIGTATVDEGDADVVFPYIVMPPQGGTLKDFMKKHGGRVPVKSLKGVAERTAAALIGIHEADYVHGDIKPDNILEGDHSLGFEESYLGDFGSAGIDTEKANIETILISPRYSAPELWYGKIFDSSDDYSFGLTLFSLVTRRRFFDVEDPKEIKKIILSKELPAYTDKRIKTVTPGELQAPLRSVLNVDPDKRKGTKEFSQDFIAVIDEVESRRSRRPTTIINLSPVPTH